VQWQAVQTVWDAARLFPATVRLNVWGMPGGAKGMLNASQVRYRRLVFLLLPPPFFTVVSCRQHAASPEMWGGENVPRWMLLEDVVVRQKA